MNSFTAQEQAVLKGGVDLMDDLLRGRIAWLQHLLLLSVTVLGLLAALQTTISDNPPLRLALALAVVLLALGTTTGCIALWGYRVYVPNLRLQGYLDKAPATIRESRAVGIVSGKIPTRYAVCERICYVCLFGAIIALVAYTILLLCPLW